MTARNWADDLPRDLAEYRARLERTVEQWRALDALIGRMNLRAIALLVRWRYPQAVGFELEWSDQGSDDWFYRAAYDRDGQIPGSGIDYLPFDPATPLVDLAAEHSMADSDREIWVPLCTDPTAFARRKRCPDVARLDIAAVLGATENVA